MNHLLDGLILAEGDTGIARFWCGCCGRNFRAHLDAVVQVDHKFVCGHCIRSANPERLRRGLKPIPLLPGSALEDGQD